MMIYECLMLMLMLCKLSYARLTPEVLQFWTHRMQLLGDMGHVESRYGPFGDGLSVGAR